MNPLDYSIVLLYLIIVIGMGVLYRKRASADLSAYFLGGNRMHWLALAMSGSVSNFDITGTMWIISMLFIFGMKSMWVHWMWGVMMGAFCLAFTGKWVRRSGVMTGAEWMITRFGQDRGGRTARTAYAFMAVLTHASFIGYAFQGIGKFAAVYLPFSPMACALIIILVTTLYVLLGGLYSVVVTDVIQTVILTIAAVTIMVVAYHIITPDTLKNMLPAGWESLRFSWRMEELANTEYRGYEFFGALVMVWVLKGMLLNTGGPAQMYDFQRFLAAKTPADASKTGAAWSLFLIVRWGMAMGIVLLALTGLSGIHDPEQVMPVVLKRFLPAGVRGIVIAGLLAAFMSTFSSTLNSGASYLVRDFWQPYLKKRCRLSPVGAGRLATILMVVVGISIGFQADSIAQIWNWMMMALGAGVVVPNVLRWYWWRLNGWGYAAGTLSGILTSLLALFLPELPIYAVFPPVVLISLIASVTVSLATAPVEMNVLTSFFSTVRPFGVWLPVRRRLNLAVRGDRWGSEGLYRAAVNTVLGMAAITGLYLAPMYFVGHWTQRAIVWIVVAVTACYLLYWTWYKPLKHEM